MESVSTTTPRSRRKKSGSHEPRLDERLTFSLELWDAFERNDPVAAMKALNMGAKPKDLERMGKSPLERAVDLGDLALFKALLPQCDLEARSASGVSALALAAYLKEDEMARLLLDAGADAMAIDHHGRSPLMLAAAAQPSLSTLNLFAARLASADFDVQDAKGMRALDYAVAVGSLECCQLLADRTSPKALADSIALAQSRHLPNAAAFLHSKLDQIELGAAAPRAPSKPRTGL
jgi:ankyrin repeat protein